MDFVYNNKIWGSQVKTDSLESSAEFSLKERDMIRNLCLKIVATGAHVIIHHGASHPVAEQ